MKTSYSDVEEAFLSSAEPQNQSDPEVRGLQRRGRRPESGLEERAEPRGLEDDPQKVKAELLRWEEGKKWQARMEKVRSALKEKERENQAQSRQLATLRHLQARLEQEKSALQRKVRGHGVTSDQVVGARCSDLEAELEELRNKNSELEALVLNIKQRQALPRDAALESLTLRNRLLEERLLQEERLLPKEPASRASVSPPRLHPDGSLFSQHPQCITLWRPPSGGLLHPASRSLCGSPSLAVTLASWP
ncbi:Centrosomal protein [Liparis tanakae]|uniref:Centrosomal protein n=1 Tax=Liparis tanakae TaxID=230148 RepID=A0A4Z2G5A6_9TELE|nr:Centrosomal protein [Liparis tanakae]